MKVIFLGTPNFVIPVLEKMHQNHTILAVFCQPDKLGNRNRLTSSPVKNFAIDHDIKVFSPDRIDEDVISNVKKLNPDVMVCCAYGKILPQSFLDICPVLNIHPSKLPKYRGSSPIQWALINGEKEIAVTVMKLCFKMDAGDIILQKNLAVTEEDNAQTLLEKSFIIGAEMLDEVLSNFTYYSSHSVKQNEEEATVFPMLTKEDGKIDFSNSAEKILGIIRGLYVWPVAHCTLSGKNFKIYKAEVCSFERKNEQFGTVVQCGKNGIVVSCGQGFLRLLEVQIEGGKRMSAKDFANGNQIKVGDMLC